MNSGDRQEVVVVDIQMRFWSMVGFMVKWAIATIPALIILIVIGAIVIAAVGSVVGGFGSGMVHRL